MPFHPPLRPGRALPKVLLALCLSLVAAAPASAGPPAVGAASATNITDTSATLTANFDGGGEPTTFHFDYGTTTAYGTTTTETQATGGQVQQSITGLTPGTTYQVRVTVTNASGTDQQLGNFQTTGTTDTDGDGTPNSSDGCPTQVGPASNGGCPIPPPPPFTPGTPAITTLGAGAGFGPKPGTFSMDFAVNGVVNPHGQRGTWSFEWGLFPDFRTFEGIDNVGGGCGSPNGQGSFEGYNQSTGTDHTDHPVSARCTVPTVSFSPRRPTMYIRLGYSSGVTCPGQAGRPQGCYGATTSFTIPASAFIFTGAINTQTLLPGGLSAGTVRVTRTGAFTLPRKVDCTGSSGDCKVVNAFTARVAAGSAKTLKLGGSKFTVTSGKKRAIKLRLTRKGLKLLKRKGKIKGKVKTKLTRAGKTYSKTVRVTLKAPRKR
jgi:hypothetical protein